MRLVVVLVLATLLGGTASACARPPARSDAPEGPTRLAIFDPDYGASADHPDAIGIGARVDSLVLPLADGGAFELDDAAAAGPVLLVWIGGAEHALLTDWARALDRKLAELEQREATLVFVRPLEPDAALRWATELHLQTPVAGDPNGDLAAQLDALAEPLEFAVLIVVGETVAYRKLGGRRPELSELLAVLDGEADNLRCCPGACVGMACE